MNKNKRKEEKEVVRCNFPCISKKLRGVLCRRRVRYPPCAVHEGVATGIRG